MKVSIHQPDFLPWLGFWAKMIKSDTMVILDHTENNPRDANSWLRRVKLFMGHDTNWLGVSLVKVKGTIGIPISDILINIKGSNIDKSLITINQTYKKAPFFNETFDLIKEYFYHESDKLFDRNNWFINKVKDLNNIETNIVYSSSLDCQCKSTEMLIEIVKKNNGTLYISGDGAAGYMDTNLFKNNNLGLIYNNFRSPSYNQFNTKEFVAGLSVIDYFMNHGLTSLKTVLNYPKE